MLPASFFSGRTPPKPHDESVEAIDWWNEQLYRCAYGYSHQGHSISGRFYHFLNFFKMIRINRQSGEEEFHFPYYCNTDRFVFDAIEDCWQDKTALMLLTSGGSGKTYIASSVVAHTYTFFPRSHSIVSAAYDTPATTMMKFIEDALDGYPAALRRQRYPYAKYSYIESAIRKKDGTVNEELSFKSVIEKIIYGYNSGALRSKRPTLHIYEEIGNWVNAAKLSDCVDATQARYKRGGKKICMQMLLGTGGQVKNEVIQDIKHMIETHEAYDLYLCDPFNLGKKTIFFIPAYKKATGFYEHTGVMDEAAARVHFEAERERVKASAASLLAQKREFPFTLEEIFLRDNRGGLFYPEKLQLQYKAVTEAHENQDYTDVLPEIRCTLIFNKKTQSVDIFENEAGKVCILEKPYTHELIEEGEFKGFQVPDNLYVGGYDGIDIAKSESADPNGSEGALVIKKRTTPIHMTNNLYVCFVSFRPEHHIDELHEQVYLACLLYNARINIEWSKISLKRYFEQQKALFRLIKRPKATVGDNTDQQIEKQNDQIGTIPTEKNILYGINLLRLHLFHYYANLYFLRAIQQLIDFTYEERKKFDLVMAMLMCELADEDQPMFIPPTRLETRIQTIGEYYDEWGIKRWGIIPEGKEIRFELATSGLTRLVEDRYEPLPPFISYQES